MKKLTATGALLAAVSACAPAGPADPVVTQFNGDSVALQLPSYVSYQPEADRKKSIEALHAEAQTICSKGHGKRAELVSSRNIMQGSAWTHTEYLYLCLR